MKVEIKNIKFKHWWQTMRKLGATKIKRKENTVFAIKNDHIIGIFTAQSVPTLKLSGIRNGHIGTQIVFQPRPGDYSSNISTV